MNAQQIREYGYRVGSLLLILGAVLRLLPLGGMAAGDYMYALGALLYLLSFMLTPVADLDMRTRRLYRMNVLSGAFFVVSAALIFLRNDSLWLLFFTIGVVYMIYASVLLLWRSGKKGETNKKSRQ
ncbi:hypothetical protein [Porphyromonas loveana]|uniref:Uncharacterized protein n=1 Tax=Porphyromonas loveana TaxID=1884669 RepID=A0A2U1F7G2_9PORP|nr:hypothetical protein [Porphyromonas loveana]PVZ08102.1 hypothetical protein C7382_11535 [Porphyromonas loveana]